MIHSSSISTHTSRVGCDQQNKKLLDLMKISTHTSRVGCDLFTIILYHTWLKFLLTHPVWDVTLHQLLNNSHSYQFLLTHPVWDVTEVYVNVSPSLYHFYSHIPCGMWPLSLLYCDSAVHFYSHIPCGMWLIFSCKCTAEGYFYSHIPCGMWLYSCIPRI